VINVSFENLGYKLKIIEFEAQETFSFDKFSLKILALEHSIESFAFYLKENDITNKLNEEKLQSIGLEPSPLYGELQYGNSIVFQGKKLEPTEYTLDPIPGRSLIIAGDNKRPDILEKYLENLDLLVHECTYTQEDYDHLQLKVMHTTAKELGRVVQKMRVKNLIASHINPRYNTKSTMGVEVILNEIKGSYKGRLFIANDFDVYRLDRNSVVKKL